LTLLPGAHARDTPRICEHRAIGPFSFFLILTFSNRFLFSF
jgi:hypothetical protein